jgi:hypothetical protein
MKRSWLILIGGVVLALLAYGGSYLAGSAKSREMARSEYPELSWLQREFNLSDEAFQRVAELHRSYVADCAERCERIDSKNAQLHQLLAGAGSVTPEIEIAIREAAQLRAECQTAMLQHFYQVSRNMPPDQGKRYLEWVVSCTFGSEHASMIRSPSDANHKSHSK